MRGTNFVVTPERIYIVEGAVCRLLDPASGEILGSIEMPQDDPLNPREWSYIGVYGDVLIGGLGFARYRDRHQLSFEEEDAKLKGNKAGFGSKSLDRAGSLALRWGSIASPASSYGESMPVIVSGIMPSWPVMEKFTASIAILDSWRRN
ncbi:MAG: hypothetical protein R3C12_04760 [Planctomycetaceae bacterium]